jgi:hypothetical protein
MIYTLPPPGIDQLRFEEKKAVDLPPIPNNVLYAALVFEPEVDDSRIPGPFKRRLAVFYVRIWRNKNDIKIKKSNSGSPSHR